MATADAEGATDAPTQGTEATPTEAAAATHRNEAEKVNNRKVLSNEISWNRQ